MRKTPVPHDPADTRPAAAPAGATAGTPRAAATTARSGAETNPVDATPARPRRTAPGPWTVFALRRTGRLVVSLAALVTASFAMIHLIPGDPVRTALGPTADPALVEARRQALGLDRPVPQQFAHYLAELFQGRLGESIGAGLPVSDVIAARLPATLSLALPAFLVVVLAAVPGGMWAAVLTRDGRRRRGELAFGSVTGALAAVPEFLLAVALVACFAVAFPLFPVASRGGPDSYVLPVVALSVVPAAALARIVRVETLRVLGEEYMRTAYAKRLPARLRYLRHALPNLLASSLTVGGLTLMALLTGTVLVENVFAWPGLGTTIVQAITEKDYPMVQAVVLVYGAAALLITFAVDVAVAVADPRSTVRGS
ncbi:ABC transporter permease [Streptomyces hydrogenans]|uniref:Peptide ABC transporter permease n=1 Tax=Streptomyces hydrogenans TaxID=1873719 RepID=A0ABQ3PMI8_9ACTN|nr:ABC transporter permease [Streptomyces hydrogenans]GHF97266.1 peptide ABC transporter permease [Streptomyces hydrogenans]GHI26212.1 peptide ABC transporter permease [Streptomyces hydrogenans]